MREEKKEEKTIKVFSPQEKVKNLKNNSPMGILFSRIILYRTVSVSSSDPPCKDSTVRLTTVLLKALSDQV